MKLSELTWTQVNRITWMSQPLKSPDDSAEIRVLRRVDTERKYIYRAMRESTVGDAYRYTYRAIRDGLHPVDTPELFEFISYLSSLQPYPLYKERQNSDLDRDM